MKQKLINIGRRDFLKAGSVAVASAAIALRAGTSRAQAKLPHLDEKDPQAQSLGYRQDAKNVDRKKYAKYQPGEMCANCQLFQGKPGAEWGPCAVFSGRQVHARGWCSTYVKKA